MKMDPNRLEVYNLLADTLVKNNDYLSAKKCLEDGLAKGESKRGLRFYSMVLRHMIKDNIKETIEKSIMMAKQAVKLDLKDGMSWYVLGNAYLNYYF